MISFDDVRLLEEQQIKQGDCWIYVAEANIKVRDGRLKDTARLDAECDDIRFIAERGGIVLLLAHKGRFKDGDADHLRQHAEYLSSTLCRPVAYCEHNTGDSAQQFVADLAPGSVAVMGNTRMHEGEEKNDPLLAEAFSKLGSWVAVGGFGKAHRKHASNYGILDYLPGSLTKGHAHEMELLAPWAGESDAYSVAVLGGVKKEKITVGLAGFSKIYDVIIPGGIVLNTILKAKKYDVGDSVVEDGGRSYEQETRDVLFGKEGKKICIPDEVIIASKDGFAGRRQIRISDGVPKGYMIVDYVLPPSATQALGRVVREKGRLLVAGTPGIYQNGFQMATQAVMDAMRCDGVQAVVLGGDTAAELGFEGTVSTGGGSGLYFVVSGTTPVFEMLKENKKKFP